MSGWRGVSISDSIRSVVNQGCTRSQEANCDDDRLRRHLNARPIIMPTLFWIYYGLFRLPSTPCFFPPFRCPGLIS